MVSHNGKKIIYTFKYGRSLKKPTKKEIIAITVGCIIFILIGIIGFIVMLLNNDEDAWSGFIFIAIGLGLLLTMIIFLAVENRKEREINKWLSDKDLFESKGYPWEFSSDYGLFRQSCSFGIDFKRDGKSYRKISRRQDRFFKSVEGTKLTVLYSPEYDQVMVLESTQKKE